MADVISDADRALIAAHIARHGVTRVATGVSGLDPDAPIRAWSVGWARRRSAAIQKRQENVHARVVRGEARKVIAAALGVSVATIKNDVQALKAEGRLPRYHIKGGLRERGWS